MDVTQTATRGRIEEVLSGRDDWTETQEKIQALRSEITDLEEERADLLAKAEAAEARAETVGADVELDEAPASDLEDARTEAKETRAEAEAIAHKIDRKKAAIGRLEEQAEEIRAEALEAERARRTETYRAAVQDLVDAARRLKEANRRVKDLEQSLFRSIDAEPPHEGVGWERVLNDHPGGALSRSDATLSAWMDKVGRLGYEVEQA